MDGFRLRGGPRETKTGINAEHARTKRTEKAVSIREQERDATIESRRRRQVDPTTIEPSEQDEAIYGANIVDTSEMTEEEALIEMANIVPLIETLTSPNLDVMRDSLRRLRCLSCHHDINSCTAMINEGVLEPLASLLKKGEEYGLPTVGQILWLTSNIIIGTNGGALLVAQSGFIPSILKWCMAENIPNQIQEQAIWSIGNLASSHGLVREQLILNNAIEVLVAIAYRPVKLALLRSIAWCLANLVRSRPEPTPLFEHTKIAIPTIATMLSFSDPEIMAEAAWALSSITSDTPDIPHEQKLEYVVRQPGLISRCADLLATPDDNFRHPILETFGHLSSSLDLYHSEIIFNVGAIPRIMELYRSPHQRVRQKAAWVISNLAAGTMEQVDKLQDLDVFNHLFVELRTADNVVQTEICFTIANAVSSRNAKALYHIAKIGWLTALVQVIGPDSGVGLLKTVIDALFHFLEYGSEHTISHAVEGQLKDVNIYLELLQKVHYPELLMLISSHTNDQVSKKALYTLKRFFGMADDFQVGQYDENGNLAPQDNQFDDQHGLVTPDEVDVNQIFEL